MTQRKLPLPFVVLALMAVLIGVELLLQAADWGLIEAVRWRTLAYQNGAFWSGLLRDWQPNYPLQPATMFASYALLHSGFSHMIGNTLCIAFLGPQICDRIGQRGFVWVCVATAVGGGLGFALLNQSPQPMIGASGVVFGLAGTLTAWLWTGGRNWTQTLVRSLAIMALLIIINVVTWWALDGLVAWETHLGGFVAGFAIIFALPRRPPSY